MKRLLNPQKISGHSHFNGGRFAGLIILMVVAVGASVAAQNPVALLNQPLSPDFASPGGKAFTLTVNGSNFVSGATVLWNGSARTTTFVSSSQVTAAINASDIAVASTAKVSVQNPGAPASNVQFFQVVKLITSISMTRNDINCGTNPQAVAVGDFNGDGNEDVVVVNGNGNSLSVFLGNGNGTFQAPTTSYQTAVGFPLAVAVGDFNNDGKLDLAVVVERAAEVSILLGNGDGTFQTHLDFITGNNPLGLALGDFNRDGNLDVAVVNSQDNTVSILLGNGNGTLQNKQDYATGSGPQSVAVGDVNGDGYLDLVTANNNDNTISVLLGNGNGTFNAPSPFATAPVPTGVILADFNKDGKLDAAVSTASTHFSILLGNGDGTFQTHVDYGIGLNSQMVAAADFNADGKLDVAVVDANDPAVDILQGNGDGTFKGAANYPTNSSPGWLAVADFNNDGKPDLVVPDATANMLTTLIQGTVSALPSLLTYGNQQAGFASSAKTVTVTNNGTSTLTISNVTISGPNANDFSQTNTCGSSIAAGANCTFSVTFTPDSIGAKTAQVVIAFSNGSYSGFGMNGSGIISIILTPRQVNFKPAQLLNTTSNPIVVSLTNQSKATITFTQPILINGFDASDFNETNDCGTSLGPLATCTMNVTFTPTQTGGLTGALNVFGTFTAGQGQQASLLAGTGTAVSVSPGSLTFPTTKVGTTSAQKHVTVSNVGSSALPITSINLQGTNPGDFAFTTNPAGNCAGSIPAQGTCTIMVTFTPTATGSRSATLNIGDPDPTGPQVVRLSGTGD
jgi:FG-GAP-like repeat/Abnormal spindle-like microcephaly-assoc'd, ASPM-SPD-2-Hydin